jgi:hypothetical protein
MGIVMIGSMAIPCTQCGYENREHYRFCGKCGALLTAPPTEVAARPAPERPSPPRPVYPVAERTTSPAYSAERDLPRSDRDVSGPSFLGLSHPAPSSGVEYLLEDEESDHAGRRRMLVALLLLAVAGALVMWRWRGGDFGWVKHFVATQSGSTPPVQGNPSFTSGPPVGQGASSPPTPSMPMASSGTEAPTSSTPPPPPSEESHMVKQEENSPQSQSPRAEKKPNPPTAKENAATDQTASDQSAEKAPDQSTDSDESNSVDDKAPVDTTKKTADATTPPASKMPQAEPPAPTNSADDALVAQGEKYLYGDGAAENCTLAQKSLQTAAAHSNARALSMLGAMYATGHCSNRDLPTAYKYFAKALRQDPSNGRIQRDLEVLWRQMNASERQAATRN